MHWIKRFSKGYYSLFGGNSFEAFQPLDFYHFNPLWYDLWISGVAKAIKKLGLEDKKFSEFEDLIPVPSNTRTILAKLITAYVHCNSSKKAGDFKTVSNLLARTLIEKCPDDPFSENSNPCHDAKEIKKIVGSAAWKDSSIDDAKNIGRLITSAGSLVHGLYNDVVTDFAWEVYGPYKVRYKNSDYTLLIRHFTNLKPSELWPARYMSSVDDIKIYSLYQNIHWEIKAVGCHTISSKGSPVESLKKHSIVVDGRQIGNKKRDKLIEELSHKARDIYRQIKKMNIEQIKYKVLLQECYQLKKLFDAAQMSWKPTNEIIKRVKNKPIPTNFLPHGVVIKNVKDYEKIFGIDTFYKEVLK